MAIDVATPVYEGPFDMLLQLILRDQVDIYEVSLSTIVDAYLTELDKMQFSISTSPRASCSSPPPSSS